MLTDHSPMLAGTIQGSSQGRTRTFIKVLLNHICRFCFQVIGNVNPFSYHSNRSSPYRTKISSPAAIEWIEAIQGMTP